MFTLEAVKHTFLMNTLSLSQKYRKKVLILSLQGNRQCVYSFFFFFFNSWKIFIQYLNSIAFHFSVCLIGKLCGNIYAPLPSLSVLHFYLLLLLCFRFFQGSSIKLVDFFKVKYLTIFASAVVFSITQLGSVMCRHFYNITDTEFGHCWFSRYQDKHPHREQLKYMHIFDAVCHWACRVLKSQCLFFSLQAPPVRGKMRA